MTFSDLSCSSFKCCIGKEHLQQAVSSCPTGVPSGGAKLRPAALPATGLCLLFLCRHQQPEGSPYPRGAFGRLASVRGKRVLRCFANGLCFWKWMIKIPAASQDWKKKKKVQVLHLQLLTERPLAIILHPPLLPPTVHLFAILFIAIISFLSFPNINTIIVQSVSLVYSL